VRDARERRVDVVKSSAARVVEGVRRPNIRSVTDFVFVLLTLAAFALLALIGKAVEKL
jgi:hypothetical protein